MSATTTTTLATPPANFESASSEAARLRNWSHLADYELHHSNTPASNSLPGPAATTSPTRLNGRAVGSHRQQHQQQELRDEENSSIHLALHNPPGWPTNHRRIPSYRPINRELDQSLRRVYTSNGERAFLTVMFGGLQINVVSNSILKTTLTWQRV